MSNQFIPEVTVDQVQAYENVRQGGLTNMWDTTTVCELAYGDIDREDCLYIMKNYGDLIELYGIDRGE